MPARPSKPKSNAAEPAPAPAKDIHPDFDEGMFLIWKRYGPIAMVAAVLVFLFYVGRMGWDAFGRHEEHSVEAAFAQARTPGELRAFVAGHPGRELSGVAELELADGDYAAGRMAPAEQGYADAVRLLQGHPLEVRAEMGLAVTEVQTGDTAAGKAALQRIMNDPAQLAVNRAEAGSQLASLAASAGDGNEVQRLATQLMQIDSNSPWTQRAFALTATVPASAPAPGAGVPAISFKPAAK